MGESIFKFWAKVGPSEKVHPADEQVLSHVDHGFDLTCLPGCFGGPLRTAPVVLLYLSPGWSKEDVILAKSKAHQQHYVRQRRGWAPLPDSIEHAGAWRWWKSRTAIFGEWADLRSKISTFNIGAYHSKVFVDAPLLAALPSSRVSLDWAQNVLFPQAIAGKRIVICMRAARFWGLQEGVRYGRSLYAPSVTRSGHMCLGEMRDQIIRAVRKTVVP